MTRQVAATLTAASFIPVTAPVAVGARAALVGVRATRAVTTAARASRPLVATDPTTGRTEPRPVTKLIIGSGEKHLVDITVDTPGPDATLTLTATDSHPFWDAADRTWVHAAALTTTDRLRTPTGTLLAVAGTRDYQQTHTVDNLTIETLHTYYVLAGDAPVLVQNCGGTINPKLVRFSQDSVIPRFSTGETIEQTAA